MRCWPGGRATANEAEKCNLLPIKFNNSSGVRARKQSTVHQQSTSTCRRNKRKFRNLGSIAYSSPAPHPPRPRLRPHPIRPLTCPSVYCVPRANRAAFQRPARFDLAKTICLHSIKSKLQLVANCVYSIVIIATHADLFPMRRRDSLSDATRRDGTGRDETGQDRAERALSWTC